MLQIIILTNLLLIDYLLFKVLSFLKKNKSLISEMKNMFSFSEKKK